MNYSIEDAKRAFEDDEIEEHKKTKTKNYILIKRVVEIGYLDGLKYVEIER